MLDRVDLIQLLRRQLARERIHAAADHAADTLPAQLLSGRERFPRHAVPSAAALFHDNQNAAHITRTSNFSFSTSLAAASFAVPSSICVCLDRCGR